MDKMFALMCNFWKQIIALFIWILSCMDKKMFDEICRWWKSFIAYFASSVDGKMCS